MTSLCKLGKNKVNEVVKVNQSDLKTSNNVVQGILKKTRNMPPNQQILIGAGSGWIMGLLAIKIGRTLALSMGGGLIFLQMACDSGYISINWDQVNHRFKQTPDNIIKSKIYSVVFKENLPQVIAVPSWIKRCVEFASQNITLSVGMLGGFLIGLATC